METFGKKPQEAPRQRDAAIEYEQNAREHFALRFDWADAVARVENVPMTEVQAHVTEKYARIFGKRATPEEASQDPRWLSYIQELNGGADPIETAMRYRKQYYSTDELTADGGREFFGPFRYDYEPETGLVWVHFGSMGWSDEERDAPKFSGDIKGALVELFKTIKARHPQAQKVVGASWLLTRALDSKMLAKGLKESLPASFIESAVQGSRGAIGGGRWGQFVDDRGKFHAKRAEEFRKRMHDDQ